MESIRYRLMVSLLTTCLYIPHTILAGVPEQPVGKTPLKGDLILKDIEPLSVVIVPPERFPDSLTPLWQRLKADVEQRLEAAKLDVLVAKPNVQHDRRITSDLKVHIELLDLANCQKYVLRIETSLLRLAYISPLRPISFMAPVWSAKPVTAAVASADLQSQIPAVALAQVDSFISECLALRNILEASLSTQNMSSTPKQAQPDGTQAAAQHGYVASKNSQIFHKSDCRFAKRITQGNLVSYENREQAVKAGKKPCTICKP